MRSWREAVPSVWVRERRKEERQIVPDRRPVERWNETRVVERGEGASGSCLWNHSKR